MIDWITAFGAVAVTPMLLFYALAFAGACVAASVYGFLQGAWPFGGLELVWAGVAPRRWRRRARRAAG